MKPKLYNYAIFISNCAFIVIICYNNHRFNLSSCKFKNLQKNKKNKRTFETVATNEIHIYIYIIYNVTDQKCPNLSI